MNEPTPGTGQRTRPGPPNDQPSAGPGALEASPNSEPGPPAVAADPVGSGERADPDTDTDTDTREGTEGTSGSEPDEDAREPGADAQAPTEADPEAPRPLGVGTEPTGHPPVDATLRRLTDADHLAVSGHLAVYEDVHRGLRDTLAALDSHDAGS